MPEFLQVREALEGLIYLAGPAGVEPAAYRLGGGRSIH